MSVGLSEFFLWNLNGVSKSVNWENYVFTGVSFDSGWEYHLRLKFVSWRKL